MKKAKDILLASDGDLSHENGDFIVGESDFQHVQNIVIASPGDYKQYPIIGFSAFKKLNSPAVLNNANAIKADLTLQLTMDGFKVRKITVGNQIGDLKIDCTR